MQTISVKEIKNIIATDPRISQSGIRKYYNEQREGFRRLKFIIKEQGLGRIGKANWEQMCSELKSKMNAENVLRVEVKRNLSKYYNYHYLAVYIK